MEAGKLTSTIYTVKPQSWPNTVACHPLSKWSNRQAAAEQLDRQEKPNPVNFAKVARQWPKTEKRAKYKGKSQRPSPRQSKRRGSCNEKDLRLTKPASVAEPGASEELTTGKHSRMLHIASLTVPSIFNRASVMQTAAVAISHRRDP